MRQPARGRAAGLALALSSGALLGGVHAASSPETPADISASPPDLAPIQSGLDYHSFANVEQFRVSHVELNLRVDFRNKVLFGEAALEVKRLDPNATELVLDTRGLDIRDVSEKPTSVVGALAKSETTWVSRPFHFDKADPILGSPLVIELPPHKRSTQIIKIEYVTSPDADSLHWLADGQTAGKHHPLMYTLSAPIGARGWIPLQDTPLVRVTYSAFIHTDGISRGHERPQRPGSQAQRRIHVRHARRDAAEPHRARRRRPALQGDRPAHRRVCGETAARGSRKGVCRYRNAAQEPARHCSAPIASSAAIWWCCRRSFPLAEVGNPRIPFISSTVITGDRSQRIHRGAALAQAWSGDLVSGATCAMPGLPRASRSTCRTASFSKVYGEARETVDRVLRRARACARMSRG